MKYSKMNEDEAALQFEERKKKILTNLIEQYAKVQQKKTPKQYIRNPSNGKKQNRLFEQLNQQTNRDQILEAVNQTQIKKIVKNALLKDIGNIDVEIQKMTKEQSVTNRSKPAYLEKYLQHSSHQNQTDMSKSEARTQMLLKTQSYYTNRQQQTKFASLIENSYSKLAESIRNFSNQKKQDEMKEQEKPKAYNFLQIKPQSEQQIIKGKTKSVNIESYINEKCIKQSKIISSERKIQKPPMKQYHSNHKIESEKTTPIKSILKQNNSHHTYDINSTKANTTQHFYCAKDSATKGSANNCRLQEAVSIYKSLKQLMNRSESADQKGSTSLLQTKQSNYMVTINIQQQSQKGIRQH